MDKKCFADMGNNCFALNEKKCENCKFYRTDLDVLQIEKDVASYRTGVVKNEKVFLRK